jgi:hypothetical protein
LETTPINRASQTHRGRIGKHNGTVATYRHCGHRLQLGPVNAGTTGSLLTRRRFRLNVQLVLQRDIDSGRCNRYGGKVLLLLLLARLLAMVLLLLLLLLLLSLLLSLLLR